MVLAFNVCVNIYVLLLIFFFVFKIFCVGLFSLLIWMLGKAIDYEQTHLVLGFEFESPWQGGR